MKKLLVVLLVLGFSAAPAMAVQWDFGASIRTYAGYYDVDEEYQGGPGLDATIGNDWDDDKGFLMGLGKGSRFNAKAMVSENFYGVVEMGLADDDTYLRLAYGVWNFGNGKLTVGKDYTPGTYLGYSNMSGDTGFGQMAIMLTDGLPYISRKPQVKFSFGDLDIAFIEQNKGANNYSSVPQQYVLGDADSLGTLDAGGDKDFSLPRIEAAYVFRTDLVNIRPVAGFQTYEVEGAGGFSEDIDSYLLGIGASFDLKPFYVKATASYMQNPGNYGDLSVGNVAFRDAAWGIDEKFHDSDLYQGTLVAGMRVNKMVNIEAGFGYQQAQRDKGFTDVTSQAEEVLGELDDTLNLASKDQEQEAFIYYLQAWISLSKNVHIIPEIGMVDRKDAEWKWDPATLDAYGDAFDLTEGTEKKDLGKMSYANVVFRLDF